MLTLWHFKASTTRFTNEWVGLAEIQRIKGQWYFKAPYGVRGKQKWNFYASERRGGWWHFKAVYHAKSQQRWHFYANLSDFEKLKGWWHFKGVAHIFDGFWHFYATIPPLKVIVEGDEWIDRFKVIPARLNDSVVANGKRDVEVVNAKSLSAGRLFSRGVKIETGDAVIRDDSDDVTLNDSGDTKRIVERNTVIKDTLSTDRVIERDASVVEGVNTSRIEFENATISNGAEVQRLDFVGASIKNESQATRISERDTAINTDVLKLDRFNEEVAHIKSHDVITRTKKEVANISESDLADDLGKVTNLSTDHLIDRVHTNKKTHINVDSHTRKVAKARAEFTSNELIDRFTTYSAHVVIDDDAKRDGSQLVTAKNNELVDRFGMRNTIVNDSEKADRSTVMNVNLSDDATAERNSLTDVANVINVLSVDRYKDLQSAIINDAEVVTGEDEDKDEKIWLIMGKPTWLHRWWQGKTRGGKE